MIDYLAELEAAWEIDGGPFYLVREGKFTPEIADTILRLLTRIDIGEMECLPRRLVAMVWIMPVFLRWNADRVTEVSRVSRHEYDAFVSKVEDRIVDILGMP